MLLMETPQFEAYRETKDLHGYMTALWAAADQNDRDSLLALLYLATQTRSDMALDLMNTLLDIDEDYITSLGLKYQKEWEKLTKEERQDDILMSDTLWKVYNDFEKQYHTKHPEHPYFFDYYGEDDLTVRRAFVNRVGRKTFQTPDIEEYRKRDDILGYMRALQKGVEEGDRESMMLQLYLTTQTSETVDALDVLIEMKKVDPEYANRFMDEIKVQFEQMTEEDREDHWKLGAMTKEVYNQTELAYQKRHPEHLSPFKYYKPDMDIILQRAYCDGAGRQPIPDKPDNIPLCDCVPQETRDYWLSMCHRDDCSSTQRSIYNDALTYVKQGDPYAMYVVAYLLRYGIETKYSHPHVTILEPNHELSLAFFKRATEAGIAKAYWGVATLVPDAEAEPWLEKGAELGDMNCLERLYRRALNAEDDRKAFGYLVQLADVWNVNEYILRLAEWYEQGRGCEKDEKKAFELAEYAYKHSSVSPYDTSHEDAVHLLRRYLENGIGCEIDTARSEAIRVAFRDAEDDMNELLTR